jgi:uncharacterized membrane protein YkgB
VKFTEYEAFHGVAHLIANHPLLSWLHAAFGIRGGAMALGVVEILIGLLTLGRWVSPTLSAVGGLMAVFALTLTLSCMLTTPGVLVPDAGGILPVLSLEVGQFLVKDAGLLAAALFILGESLQARAARASGV